MSAVVSSSVRITASAASRAPAVARRGGYAPRAPRRPLPSQPCSAVSAFPSARLASWLRAENQGLDRDAPELQEKFAIIGCVRARAPPPSTPSRRDTRPAAAHFIHRRIFPHNRSAPQPSSSQVRRTRVSELHVHLRPQERRRLLPVAAGTQFKDLPDDWRCPTCGAEKSKFKNMGKEVAGFEQNQGYGFGTNSMTGGEKSVLIYGALALFFLFFISGYLLD